MIPIKIHLSGFTSYSEAEPAEVDFSEINLACISGSNGAGKSSLLDGITYALYGEARKRDEGLINNTSKRAKVVFVFEYEGQTYRIIRSLTRGKGSQVDFMVQDPNQEWKTLTERTQSETNAAIVRTLRLDYETFVSASFFLQGKADSFSTQKPTDRKRILSSILGLDQWERYHERAKELSREKNNELILLNAKLDEIQSEINQEAERKAVLDMLEQQLTLAHAQVEAKQGLLNTQMAIQQKLNEQRNVAALLRRQWEKAQQVLRENTDSLKIKETQLLGYQVEIERADEIEAAYRQYLVLQKKIAEMDQLSDHVRPVESERQSVLTLLEVKRTELKRDIEFLKSDQQVYDQSSREMQLLTEQIKFLDEETAILEKEISRKEAIQVELDLLQNQAVALKEENAGLRTQMTELKTRLDQVNGLEGGSCPLCGQPLSEHDRDRLAEELLTEGKRMAGIYRANLALLEDNQANQHKLSEQRDELTSKEHLLQNTQRDHAIKDQKLSHYGQQKKEWETIKAPRLSQLVSELESNAFLPEARNELVRLDSQLAHLGYDPQLHSSLRTQEAKDRKHLEAWHELQLAQNQINSLTQVVSEQKKQIKGFETEVERSQTDFSDATSKLSTEEAGLPNLGTIREELMRLQEAESEINQRVGGARQQVHAIGTQRSRQATLQKEREAIQLVLGQLKSLEKTFGKDGVPAMLIEQALPELQNQTNEILQRLSNFTMSVSFQTQRAYKDAKREDKKETLDILISDGSSIRDYETYSGGEAFRVNFAIRLALSRVLSHRAGAKLQTLVIDEGFGNQDAEGRQRLIEAINMMRDEFAKILIITHIEEMKDVFPSRIEVTKGLTGSKVEVIAG